WTEGSAIRVPSALRAALIRVVVDEARQQLAEVFSTLPMDVATFYECVPAQIFLAPRLLRDRFCRMSQPIEATHSVVASAGHGPLQFGDGARSPPPSGPWSCIDDAVVRVEGSRAAVVAFRPKVALVLKEEMDEQELICPTKSEVLASDAASGAE
ncbi:unnamed protein product, partial [Prorocentrum cordatum]